MVHYPFDENMKKRDPVELEGKIPQVTWRRICVLLGLVIYAGFNIFYAQIKIFQPSIKDEICYFSTLLVIFLAGVINIIFNARLSIFDKDKHTKIMIISSVFFILVNTFCFPASASMAAILPSGLFKAELTHIITSIFIFLQVPIFLRQVFVLEYALRCKLATNYEDQLDNYYSMINAEAEAGLVNLLDSYLRGAPQQLFQSIEVLRSHDNFTEISFFEQVPIWITLAMLTWTATSYCQSLRKQQNKPFPYVAMVVYFAYNLLLLLSRIISLSAGLVSWTQSVAMGILIHWLVSTLYLCYSVEPTKFYNCSKFWHVMFCSVFGMIYIFLPINLTAKPKFWLYFCFNIIVLIENALCLTAILRSEQFLFSWMYIFAGIMFICGISLKILYYKKLHSTLNEINDSDKSENGENEECLEESNV